jgi:hypothetical protein
VAIKVFEERGDNPRLKADLENEGYIHSILHHPNIARFYGEAARGGGEKEPGRAASCLLHVCLGASVFWLRTRRAHMRAPAAACCSGHGGH